jgi:betaine-aldehyde dehydrogenase
MPAHKSLYYGGAWHDPAQGHMVETVSPGSGERLG